MAGRPGGGRNVVHLSQNVAADLIDERHIERVDQPVFLIAVERDLVAKMRKEPVPQCVAQRHHPGHRRQVAGQLAGSTQTSGKDGALGAGAAAFSG